ncbi:MAG: capsular biosynthesis protein [Acidobacteria bacterium]|nr:capsular biosynthesis protein [Acidobacteriota bacterium]
MPPSNSAAADFPQLARYRAANASLRSTGQRVRVVFLGDSITDYWGHRAGKWFAHSGWINRGIGGQTTAQLLLREQKDALELQPQAVVLESGGNDMRLGFVPAEIRDRIKTMGELAELHHVKVFVTAMTPVCDCFRQLTGLRTPERITELNVLLRDLCAEEHWTFINAADVLKDSKGLMRKDLTWDGVHPNDAGYALMKPVYEAALARYR